MGVLNRVKDWFDHNTAQSPDRAEEIARADGKSEEEVAAARADAEKRQKTIRAGGAVSGGG